MTKKLVGSMIVLLMLACAQPTFALSEGVVVTKKTQAESGLDFTLTAVRLSQDAVSVRMEIPVRGKLKNLKRVTMSIGQGSPLVSANLQTTPGKEGSLIVSFQLSPDLADKCSIYLVVPSKNPTAFTYESFYAVQLREYVTDRK